MSKITRTNALKLVVAFSVLVGFSSSVVAEDVANSDNASAWQDSRALVFGKFRLLKNGNETKLGEGMFSNVAALRLYRPEDQEEFTGRVGENGEISMKLSPGEYYVNSITFRHQGERIEPETNFRFVVSADHKASYIGTITLETSFSNGYHGMKGSFDRFTVRNDCAESCDQRLAELGLVPQDVAVTLPTWQEHLALNGH